jgi:hypothetical protein
MNELSKKEKEKKLSLNSILRSSLRNLYILLIGTCPRLFVQAPSTNYGRWEIEIVRESRMSIKK